MKALKVLRMIVSWILLIFLLSFGWFYFKVIPDRGQMRSDQDILENSTICLACNGSGREKCASCQGTGKRIERTTTKCPQCGGTGVHMGKLGRTRSGPCVFCNSTGTIVKEEKKNCYNCGGRGYVRCAACGGTGRLVERKHVNKFEVVVEEVKRTVPMYGDWLLNLIGLKKESPESEEST